MAETAARILYALASCPPQDKCSAIAEPDRCRVCAGVIEAGERAAPYERWQGSNFTDQNKLRYIAGSLVCEACVWAHAWSPPPGHPPPEDGKKGVNLRLYSHLYDQRGYVYVNKGDKPAIRQWLCAPKSPPWFAAIADTGQKHVIPWTPINRHSTRGVVRFEESDVHINADALRTWVADTCDLLTAGATKAEIETGTYRPQTWRRCRDRVEEYERSYRLNRGSHAFDLVVWLSQRDEDGVTERLAREKEAKDGRRKTRSNHRSGGGPADGGAERVPRERGERAEALGPAPRSGPAGDADQLADERVGDDASKAPATGESEQLGLFGDGGTVPRGGRG